MKTIVQVAHKNVDASFCGFAGISLKRIVIRKGIIRWEL